MKSFFLSLIILGSSLMINSAFAQTLSLPKTVYAPGEKIVVSYSGFSGDAKDWIDVVPASYSDGQGQGNWQYTNGATSGTMEFAGKPYGEYEVRGFFRNESTPVRVRFRFNVGNIDQNIQAKTEKPVYLPSEKVKVTFSGFPGNSKDWIDVVPAAYADGQGQGNWQFTNGTQSGTMEFNGFPEGNYEVRVFFNNESSPVRYRYPFTVGNTVSKGKICRKELSTFYAGMNSFGLCWGRLGSDAFVPQMISDVQVTLGNVIAALHTIPCLDYDANKISNFSSHLPSLSRQQAVDEINQIILDILASIKRANISCDLGTSLESLFVCGVHLGAAQAIANTFICRPLPADWQQNVLNHLLTARNGIAGFIACIPGVNQSVFNTVPVAAANAYEPFSVIVGIQTQILWAVSLSDCCCNCK